MSLIYRELGESDNGVTIPPMASPDYHQQYWQDYKKRTKQVSVTMTLAEHKMWKEAAQRQGRRSVGAQLKAEALAYRDGEYLPELDTQHYLTELIHILRGIGNNLNQIAKHSNTVRRAVADDHVIQTLQTLEQTADGFTRQVNAKTHQSKS